MSPGAVLKHWLRLKVSMFVQYELLQNTGWRPTFEKGLKRAPGVLLHISKQLPRRLAKARWTVPNMEVTTRQPIHNMSYRFSCGRCLLRWRWHCARSQSLPGWCCRSYSIMYSRFQYSLLKYPLRSRVKTNHSPLLHLFHVIQQILPIQKHSHQPEARWTIVWRLSYILREHWHCI